MARTKQTARQIPTPSHAEVEHAFAQLSKKARQPSTTGTAIQSSAMHGSVLESLPEELWYIVMTHSAFDDLARLALANRLWAFRVRPALSFPCSCPYVYDLITEAQDAQFAKVLAFVEVRYGLTLSDAQLRYYAVEQPSGSLLRSQIQEQQAALLAGKGRAEQMAMLATRFGSMSVRQKRALAGAIVRQLGSSLPWHITANGKGYLTAAIILRLSPAEMVALAQDWMASGFDLIDSSWNSKRWLPLAQAMRLSLTRAEWMPQQLAQLWTILLDEEEKVDLYSQIRSIGLLQVGAVIGLPAGAAALLQLACCTQQVGEVVACLPSTPLERAAALFYLHCCVRDENAEHGFSLFIDADEFANMPTLLAASLVRMQSGVSAVCHVLHVVVQLAQLEKEAMEHAFQVDLSWDDEIESNPKCHNFLVQLLRAWSTAAGYPTAFDYSDQAKLLNFVHSLAPKPKAALAPVVLEWILAAQPTGFVGYACRAMKVKELDESDEDSDTSDE